MAMLMRRTAMVRDLAFFAMLSVDGEEVRWEGDAMDKVRGC